MKQLLTNLNTNGYDNIHFPFQSDLLKPNMVRIIESYFFKAKMLALLVVLLSFVITINIQAQTINHAPMTPGMIKGPTTGLCISGTSSATYSIAVVIGATSYTWSPPAGTTITSGQGTASVTINFGSLFTSGNLSVTADNAYGSSTARVLALRSALLVPGIISGPVTGLCMSGTSRATYSIGAVIGATSYTWTSPAGTSITSGQGTTSVIINFSSGFTSGNLSVTANNECGSSTARVLALKSTLLTPGMISGPVTGLCISGISSATYSIGAVIGATSYTWTPPAGTTIISGQGTTSVTVNFGSLFTSGNLSVRADNACGSSTARVLALKSTLLIPGMISGPTTGLCISGISSATYSIPAVIGATSYTWTPPAGTTITSGQGTPSVIINFGSGFTSGNLSVTADNACGSSSARVLAVRSTLLTPGMISGPTIGLCVSGISNATYSIPSVIGATSYTWTPPAGTTITSGQGTTSVIINFGNGFTSGNLSVTANNACGSSSTRLLTLRSLPSTPALITGNISLCSNQTGVVYSITTVLGATGYTWAVPSGATITSGQGTNSITVDFGLTGGHLSVMATNACGSSMARTISIVVANCNVNLINKKEITNIDNNSNTDTSVSGLIVERNISGNISDPANSIKINIYPNPTNGKVVIEYANPGAKKIVVEIFNILGVRVYTNEFLLNKNSLINPEIDLTSKPKGIYSIRINDVIYKDKIVLQ